jgi:GAF domain-containing protein
MSIPDRSPRPVSADMAFEQLAGIALAEHSLHSVLQTVADLTKTVVPGAVEASVILLLAGKGATVVSTGRLAVDLDECQAGFGHGPCLHAAGTGETVEVSDTRTERRWADYMQHAVVHGCLSSLSLPLGSPEAMGAALNIYAREPAAFDEERRQVGRRFAGFAGVAVANMQTYQGARELARNMEVALGSRAVIDQAKGILMERYKLSADQAFRLLAQTSMGTNRKLRDIADHLVATGELPPPRRAT